MCVCVCVVVTVFHTYAESIFEAVNSEAEKREIKEKRSRKMSTSRLIML